MSRGIYIGAHNWRVEVNDLVRKCIGVKGDAAAFRGKNHQREPLH